MSINKSFRTNNSWTEKVKKEAVRCCLNGESKSVVMRKYDIGSYTVLYRWINKFGSAILAEQLSVMPKRDKPKLPKSGQTKEEALMSRIADLERQLEDSELKSRLLEKMIDIAEEDLKISIRKKSGPRQPVSSKQRKK